MMKCAGRILLAVSMLLPFFGLTALAAEYERISDEEVAAYIRDEAEKKLAALEQRAEKCREIRDATEIRVTPKEVRKRFQEIGLSKERTQYTLIHLSRQNEQRCIHGEAADLLFSLDTLDKLNRESGLDVKLLQGDREFTPAELQNRVINSRLYNYRLAVLYKQLPMGMIAFLENSFGTTPFNGETFAETLPE